MRQPISLRYWTSQDEFRACRSKMRMSGLCKVEMSGFIQGGRRDGNGANRDERERAGAAEGVAASRRRSPPTNRSGPAARFNRPAGGGLAEAAAPGGGPRSGALAARAGIETQTSP